MSNYGAKFPEGIDPVEYRELMSIEEVVCPYFRRVVLKSFNSETDERFTCEGCGTRAALIAVIDLETERFFVRRDSNCDEPLTPEMVERRKTDESGDEHKRV